MKTFFELLCPEAQEDLIRHGIIELVTVRAAAEQDPERPDDRLRMSVSGDLGHEFRPGNPWIDAELQRIREICMPAGEDLSVATQDSLLVDLNRERREQDELRAGRIGGQPVKWFSDPQTMELVWPSIKNATPEVMVWCHCWTLEMDDGGQMTVDCEAPLYYKGLDDESRARIDERLRKVNAGIGKIVERLIG